VKSSPGCCRDIHGQTEVMRQRVGRAHGQNRKSGIGICQHLDHVMDGAVSTTGKNRVTACEDGLPRLLLRVSARVGEDELSFDICATEYCQDGFQLCLAARAAATGVGVIE